MPYKDPEKRREAARRHYRNNKQAYIRRSKWQTRKIRKSIYDYKEARPCTDCGVQYPHYVMEFDHVRGEKVEAVANMINRNCTLKVWEEIAKCELVCANCHRSRTHVRMTERRLTQELRDAKSNIRV